MSEVVERVARAIGSTVADQGDVSLGYHLAHKAARAAIEAMREPTKAMIEVMMYFDLERACHDEDNCTHYLWENEAPILAMRLHRPVSLRFMRASTLASHAARAAWGSIPALRHHSRTRCRDTRAIAAASRTVTSPRRSMLIATMRL